MSFRGNYIENLFTYNLNAASRRVLHKDLINPRYNKTVLTDSMGNDLFFRKIKHESPFAIVRLGGTEIRTIADVLYSREKTFFPIGGVNDRTLRRIRDLSGFYPSTEKNVEAFVDMYLDLLPDVDVLCVWNCFMQSYFADNFTKAAVNTGLYALEPYYFNEPWSKALEGKKVMVIHPFAETIEKQFLNKDKLFVNKKILPDFELRTIVAVQSLGGFNNDFSSWFEALDWMVSEALKTDFDIALIGCGAYGLPLAIKLKQAGKQAIQIGGALQLLFGIKGNRWEQKLEAKALFNDYWVRPSENEIPKAADKVEGACYW